MDTFFEIGEVASRIAREADDAQRDGRGNKSNFANPSPERVAKMVEELAGCVTDFARLLEDRAPG